MTGATWEVVNPVSLDAIDRVLAVTGGNVSTIGLVLRVDDVDPETIDAIESAAATHGVILHRTDTPAP